MNNKQLTKEQMIKEVRNIWKFNYTLAPDEVFTTVIQLLRNAPEDLFKKG